MTKVAVDLLVSAQIELDSGPSPVVNYFGWGPYQLPTYENDCDNSKDHQCFSLPCSLLCLFAKLLGLLDLLLGVLSRCSRQPACRDCLGEICLFLFQIDEVIELRESSVPSTQNHQDLLLGSNYSASDTIHLQTCAPSQQLFHLPDSSHVVFDASGIDH